MLVYRVHATLIRAVEDVQTASGRSTATDNPMIIVQRLFIWTRGNAYSYPLLSLLRDMLEHDVPLVVLGSIRQLVKDVEDRSHLQYLLHV